MRQDEITRKLNEIIVENGGEVLGCTPEVQDVPEYNPHAWHPYPETEPVKNGNYLVTFKRFDPNPKCTFRDSPEPPYLETFTLEVMEMAFMKNFYKEQSEFLFPDEATTAESQIWMKVIAWTELPEPYKPEGEE